MASRELSRDGDAFGALLDRLAGLVESETEALCGRDVSTIDDFTSRKEHALLELMRFARPGMAASVDPRAADNLKRLRARLTENMTSLANYIGAMRELTGAIADSIAAEESDGTYARTAPPGRSSP